MFSKLHPRYHTPASTILVCSVLACVLVICPVAWSDHHGGYYTLTRYEDVKAASLDRKRLRSGQPFIARPDFTQSIAIDINPPEHATFRRLLNKYFVPARMAELGAARPGVVDEHLDDLPRLGPR